ncbi:MAG: hypothetical protein GW893_16445 [Armatimonadetes bacterium]|nr:hypothetical protein [Armatimonadota bacterium]
MSAEKEANDNVRVQNDRDAFLTRWYVLSSFYADEKKGYPVNFQFRLVADSQSPK